MARSQRSRRQGSVLSAEAPDDLHDYTRRPTRRLRRSRKVDPIGWTVTDDWPEEVPVTEAEVDVFEAWFGDLPAGRRTAISPSRTSAVRRKATAPREGGRSSPTTSSPASPRRTTGGPSSARRVVLDGRVTGERHHDHTGSCRLVPAGLHRSGPSATRPAEGALDRLGPSITPQTLKTF